MRREYVCGQSQIFRWVPPDGWGRANTATLALYFSAGTSSAAMTARASDELSAISADRRRLTLTWSGTALVPDDAVTSWSGWIDDGAGAQIPIRILRLVSDAGDSGVVELAEPLPHAISTGGDVYVQVWQRQFAAPASPETVRYRVTWERSLQGGVVETVTDEGVCYMVRALFATGLTHQAFCAHSPFLAAELPPGTSSWAPQIQIALDALMVELRKRLPSAVDVSAVRGGQFLEAHAVCTELVVLRAIHAGGRDRTPQIEEARRRLAEILDAIFEAGLDWVDSDGDGAIDAGETRGGSTRVTLRAFTTSTTYQDAADSDAEDRTPMTRRRVEDER
jgi:hypothetical protein